MTKILFRILFCAAAFMANGCASVQVVPTEAMGPDVYLISARSTSRKILSETVKSAKERCDRENKQYLFMKNIFQYSSSLGIDMVSYDLYFTCVETGDPRLNERKSLPRPSEEKVDQSGHPGLEVGPGFEKVVPEKGKPPALGQTGPAKEPVEEKPAVSSGKAATPAPEKPLPPKGENQGIGEPESLRKDAPLVSGEAEQDSPVIEESLDGYVLDKENYLKRRFLKKKKTN